jgi:phosphatidylglycerol lysyltransferase
MVEWIIQGRAAPNGTASALIDAAFRTLSQEGATWATLGLAALSSTAPTSATAPPLVARALLAWTRAHARRFYNFEGLERFKAKFQPTEWEPIRLYTDQTTIRLSTLYALADAFAGERSPVGLVSRAIANAAHHEARFARNAVRSRLSSMLEN